jgi:hypothetical protein
MLIRCYFQNNNSFTFNVTTIFGTSTVELHTVVNTHEKKERNDDSSNGDIFDVVDTLLLSTRYISLRFRAPVVDRRNIFAALQQTT